MIFCDELAFMNVECILQSIIPVAQQENTVLLGTTTPLGSDNIVSHMITVKDDDGEPIIAGVRIGRPCAECREKRILCVHIENATAEGLSRKKRKRFANLFAHDKHKMMREFQGEISDSDTPLFQPKWLKALAERPPIAVRGPIRMLMMTMDPAAGGANEFSTVCCYYDFFTKMQAVVLLDSYPLKPASPKNIRNCIRRCIVNLRAAHPQFQEPPIVIAVESAPKTFAEQVAEYVDQMLQSGHVQNVHTMCEMPEDRPGVPKTNENTQDMVGMAQQMLENDEVAFSSAIFTNTADADVESMKIKLLRQLANFKKRVSEVTNDFAMPTIRMDGKGGGANDDMAVAYLMNRYWSSYFRASTKESYMEVKRYSAMWERNAAESSGFTFDELYGPTPESKIRLYEFKRQMRADQERRNRKRLRENVPRDMDAGGGTVREMPPPSAFKRTRYSDRQRAEEAGAFMSEYDSRYVAPILVASEDSRSIAKNFSDRWTVRAAALDPDDAEDGDQAEGDSGIAVVDAESLLISERHQRDRREMNSGCGQRSELFNTSFYVS